MLESRICLIWETGWNHRVGTWGREREKGSARWEGVGLSLGGRAVSLDYSDISLTSTMCNLVSPWSWHVQKEFQKDVISCDIKILRKAESFASISLAKSSPNLSFPRFCIQNLALVMFYRFFKIKRPVRH